MLSWLLESSAVAAALAIVTLIAGRSRKIGPSTRHALWVLVVVRLMTPPLFHWPAVPAWPTLETSVSRIDSIAPAGIETASTVELAELDFEAIEPEGDSREIPPIEAVSDPPSTIISAVAERSWPEIVPWLLGFWLLGSIAWVGNLAARVFRFRRRLVASTGAPEWLESLLDEVGRSMNVRVPAMRVVADLESPLLWCLGRPSLLIPSKLLGSLDAEAWRGILAHELAHIRRGDPWFGRLLLLAGAVFWWHPLYRLARARIESEAELACDAWVVGVLPEGRRRYASTLVDVCETLTLGRGPIPALGVVGGPGRLLERRLVMILREHVSPRTSPAGLLALGLLAALSIPSWSRAQEKVESKVVIVTSDDPKPGEAAPKPEPAPKPDDPTTKVERKVVVRKANDGDVRFQVEVNGKSLDLEALKSLPAQIHSQIQLKALRDINGDEIAKQVKEALEKANVDEATRTKILEQLKTLHDQVAAVTVQGRSSLTEAEAQVQKARAQLAEAEARLKAEAAKLSVEVRKLESEARGVRQLRITAPREAARGRGLVTITPDAAPKADLEKRMEKLESKVDALLDELKAIRKEKSGKAEASKVEAVKFDTRFAPVQ